MSPKRYFIAVLALGLGLTGAAWALAWWLEPLYGELTRIGGYAERDYGWNEPVREFVPRLATWDAGHDGTADVLVIGDSFANLRPAQQWQNWLAARTGWRIRTLDKHRVDLGELTASPAWAGHPPKVVIWNNIERDLRDEYSAGNGACALARRAESAEPLAIRPTGAQPAARSRPSEGINPGFARAWLWKNLLRRTLGLDYTETLRVPLVRGDLFSSRSSSELLVFRRDLRKRSWTPADLERIRCGYRRLARIFEANGRTRFVTAIAPDKSSAYRPWLQDPRALPESVLPALLERFPVPDARLDRAISQALSAGTRDVYLPDDTHWGPAGQRIAAEAILELLVREGLARR
ncbi:MAG: hypothetical protein Fur0039_22080 [Rhodocyclaceae bacterium]